MITPVLKFSEIKVNPNVMLGLDHAFICKHSTVVAHVVSPERMTELLEKERQAKQYLTELSMIASGELHPSDLINL